MDIQQINELVKTVDTNYVSDGYHTFGELYTHRICLFIALCKFAKREEKVWCTPVHSDGSVWEGWFLLGIGQDKGKQITYHLPNEYYEMCCEFAEILDKAPEFDGHTSDDVLNRLLALL